MTGLADWLEAILGMAPRNLSLYERALTHGSHGANNYQRLEFLGDRVLGLLVAEWLIETFPAEREGVLSQRLHRLVSSATCAEVARAMVVRDWLRLGKQAQDAGAFESEYVLGDVAEALIGALYSEYGLDAARNFVRRWWAPHLDGKAPAPRHPKSLLHEWAEAQRRKPPVYTVIERSGPDHAPRFRVRASLGSAGEAEAEGSSKAEAERAAAAALLARLG